MNIITLKGIIKDIKYSHTINDIEYYKANLLVPRDNGKEDIINLKFKKFSNNFKDSDSISLTGNIRTYSTKENNKNKVELYVFTYFDRPEDDSITNEVILDGTICKSLSKKKTAQGKDVYDFILANNLPNDNRFLNVYCPMVAWGKLAKELSKLPIGTRISVKGQLKSREYKKFIDETNYDIKIAHEVAVSAYILQIPEIEL